MFKLSYPIPIITLKQTSMKQGFTSVVQMIRNSRMRMNRVYNPGWDQMHRTTRVPEFSVVSVLGGESDVSFVHKALNLHARHTGEVLGQNEEELLDFANRMATPVSYEQRSGHLLHNFPSNLEQGQTYERMTDGLNLVIASGVEGELVDYYRQRGQLMDWSYNAEESEEENLTRFYRDFSCAVKK